MKKNPCEPGCPRRTETCHGNCKVYLAFYHDNRREGKARSKKNEADYQAYQTRRREIDRRRKEKERKSQ